MNVRKISSGAEEALETAAQTKAEAAKGDQQAVRRLARQAVQGRKNPSSRPKAAETR